MDPLNSSLINSNNLIPSSLNQNEMNLLIVGGSGSFGAFYAKIFKEERFNVFITSRHFEKVKEVAKQIQVNAVENPNYLEYDYICLSVPNESAPSIAKKIIPKMKKGSILFDFCSVKEKICSTFLKFSKKNNVELVSVHPMHGPRINGIKNQPVAWIDINGKTKAQILKDFFIKQQAKVIATTSEKHDKTLSIVQGLTHYTMFVSSSVLRESKQDIEETILLASPNYKLFLMEMSRIVLQNPALYSEIQITNPHNAKIRKLFTSEAKKLEKICKKKNQEKLSKKITQNAEYFKKGNFLLEESDKAVEATSHN